MINNLKKGETVLIVLDEQNTKNVLEINGVIGEISENNLKIYHNFSGKKFVDYTLIKMKYVREIKKITYTEIHKLSDLI